MDLHQDAWRLRAVRSHLPSEIGQPLDPRLAGRPGFGPRQLIRVSRSTSTGVHQSSLVKSQLLYQLSYAGAPVIVFAESSAACRRSHGRPPALLSNCCQTSKLLSTFNPVGRGEKLAELAVRRRRHLALGPDSIGTSSGLGPMIETPRRRLLSPQRAASLLTREGLPHGTRPASSG